MRYYSDITKCIYDTKEECQKAEETKKAQALKEKEASEKRAARAKEVEAAYHAAVEASQKYEEMLNEFLNEFGSFHMTWSNPKSNTLVGARSLAKALINLL